MTSAEVAGWVSHAGGLNGSWVAQVSIGSSGLQVVVDDAAPDVSVASEGDVRCLLQGFVYGLPAGSAPGDTPAQIVLTAYLRAGPTVLDDAKGFFSFVLWDGRRDELLAARDPLGIHPLFHASTSGGLVLAPSVATLLAQPGVRPTVNRAALADHLRHLWPRPTETYFEAVTRLPPGHTMTVRHGAASIRRYWDPLFPGRCPDWVDEADLGQFDELLDESVSRVLDLGPTGIYLSGGLDSVAVGALSADQARRRAEPVPLALSLVFPAPYGEQVTQAGVAGQLGLPQVFAQLSDVLGEGGLIGAALRNGNLSAPMQNPWLPAYQGLAGRARAEGREVILTGSGGDEWLTVTPLYAADLIRSGNLVELVRLSRAQARSYDVSPLLLARNMAWRFGARPLLAAERDAALRRVAPGRLAERRLRARQSALDSRPWLAPDAALRRVLLERDEEYLQRTADADELLPVGGPRQYFRECREALTHPLVSMEAEEVFEYSRRAGVRVLHPYWDTRLVEFLHACPPRLLNRDGRSKGLIREMLARRFPTLGFERQRKTITASYFGRTVVAQAPDAWTALGGAEALASIGVIDPERSSALYDEARRVAGGSRSDPDHRTTDPMWEILTLESWLRAHT